MKKGIRLKRGFTIVEVLIATAILAIFVSMAAVGTSAMFGSGERMMTISKAAVLGSDVMKAVTNEVRFGESFRFDEDGNMTYNSTAYGENCSLAKNEEDGRLVILQSYIGQNEAGGTQINWHKFFPIGSAAYGEVWIKSISFSKETESTDVIVCTLSITSDGEDTLWENTAKILPISLKV